ncbi:hypothetical protein [Wolbachia endosymbiont (group A) of Beris morrisii]|uniref:hypothetical protein n=1 Tax=Wolbachia endosymbiont (group A) of Beris morrisii TaxID=3066139 RepID=UPI003341403D
MKNDKFVIPLLVSGIYTANESTAVRTLQLAGNLRNRRCHPSAPTLGSSLSIIYIM